MYNLLLTCQACPEQYDIIDENGNCKAYIRLRWGTLRCTVPDVGGEEIYYYEFDDSIQGAFYSEACRTFHLEKILEEFCKYYNTTRENIFTGSLVQRKEY